ncbi:MAG TPA: hypothetical protein VJ914_36935 [Pseudonocardiaceae bacterium]|nr:hypothetical protein [Pseudonocardiaceae bacterium]
MGGYTATQIYQMLHSGPGTTGIYHATDGAGTQLSTQDDLNNQIVQLNNKMAASWNGVAAEQAQAGAMPLAGAAQDATSSLALHQDVMTQQAEAFTTARNSVTNVPAQMPNNTMNDVLAAFGDTGPLDDQITQYNNSSQNNVQVYQTYAQQSALTEASVPQSYGTIPVSNATITVVPPSSTGASGGYAGMNSIAAVAGGTQAERAEAMRRLTGAPGANATGGANLTDETSGAGSGLIDVPPGGGRGPGFPNAPGEPNFNTNPDGFVPPLVEEEVPLGAIPAGGRNGNNNDEGNNPAGGPPPMGPNSFSGDLNGGLNGPSGGGFGPAGGGGSAQSAMESLHGGSGLGSGSGASNLTNSSRSGIGMASQATEESMMGGGGLTPGAPGAPGEEGPMGGGAGGRREEDGEHKAASYLQENDPDALFGTDEMTAPPVIGE